MATEPEVNLKIKAKSDDAQRAVDEFKAKLDKVTKGGFSVLKDGGLGGLGKALGSGFGIGGVSLGGLAGGALGGLASGVGQEVGQLKNAITQSLQDSIRNDLVPGIASAVSQIQERRGAVDRIQQELGPAAAFLSQEQLKQAGKPFFLEADINAKSKRNIEQAFLGFSGEAGLGTNIGIATKGVKSTFTGEEVIDIKDATKNLNKVSRELLEGSRRYSSVFKEK